MSQTFTNGPVDWSDYFHSAPPSNILDPNQASFSFDPPPAPPTATIKSSTSTTPRVTKPARKRSRASRRTPTTLLSTDTSNFRAMVQQFTGGSSAALGGYGIGSGAIGHPLPRRLTDTHLQTTTPFAYGFQLQQQQHARHVAGSGVSNNLYSPGLF